MEVILREHVEHLGQRGDVVKVAEGYARNFLLPRKLALAVTDNNKRQIEREKKIAEARAERVGRSRRAGRGRKKNKAWTGVAVHAFLLYPHLSRPWLTR
jgi:large subunit ribosomal protein L9